MTQNIFLIADTHFGHKSVCKFLHPDGVNKLRPWDNPQEMDEELVKRWNEVVRPNDKVYHLGDVAIHHHRDLEVLARCNGDKVLIRGNHDIFKLSHYAKYFRDIRGCHVMNNIILTHIPVHPESGSRWKANIHGHLHARRVMTYNWHFKKIIDPFYFCVSVENINFRPIAYEEILERLPLTESSSTFY